MKDEKDIFDFLEKKSPKTPDASYFESLAKQVASQSEELPKAKVVPLYSRPIVWIAGAAAAVLLVFFLGGEKQGLLKSDDIEFDDLSKAEILAYVDANIDDFDEEMLVEFISTKELNPKEITEDFQTPKDLESDSKNTVELSNSLETVSTEEILEYLDDEEIDLMELEDDIFY